MPSRDYWGAIIIVGVFAWAEQGRGEEPARPKLPQDIIAAWEKAGASFGWIGRDDRGSSFRNGGGGRHGDRPSRLGCGERASSVNCRRRNRPLASISLSPS